MIPMSDLHSHLLEQVRLGEMTADEASRKAGDGWGIVLNSNGDPVLVSIPKDSAE